MKDVIKYKRGQVWMRQCGSFTHGSVQSNNRPCLIISNDRGNLLNKTVMIAKVTSVGAKASLRINVPFENDKGQENVILCNQIETVDINELSFYMFTITDEVMDKVEKAILEAQGMAYEQDIPNAISEIYKILSRLEAIKAEEIDTVDKDQEMILDTAEKLKELYTDLGRYYEQSSEEIKSRIDPYSQYLARKELGLTKSTETTNADTITNEINELKSDKELQEKPKRKNRKWTKELMEEFLTDKKNMPLKDLANKWNFDNTKSCSQTYYNIKYRYEKAYGTFE